MVSQIDPQAVTLHLDHVQEWVELLHGESEGLVNIVSTQDWAGRTFSVQNGMDDLLQYVDALDSRKVQGIYLRSTTMGQAPERFQRGSAADSLSLPGLWADIDRAGPGHKDARDLPATFTQAQQIVEYAQLPVPSYWVESGGGWYAWWLLQNPYAIPGSLGQVGRLSELWHRQLSKGAEAIGCRYPVGTHDLARVLRIPGTVNRKVADLPRQCYLGRNASTGILYQYEELQAALNESLIAMPDVQQEKFVIDTGGRPRIETYQNSPWDDFEQRVDWAEILEPAGWTLSHQHGRERFWVRPGKNPRDGHSATTGMDPARDRLYIFSTEIPGFDAGETYTKPKAWAIINNVPNAAVPIALRKAGYGEPWVENTGTRIEDWASEPGKVEPEPAVPGLPDTFWEARPALKHIREAAHSSLLSAEAILGVVLARVGAMSSHRLRIPGIVGPRSSLTVFSVLVGASGDGKSSSCGIAAQLIPHTAVLDQDGIDWFADQLPIGTGEGIAEAYYGTKEEEVPGSENKKTGAMKVISRRQLVRHNAFFYMDEGQALAQLSKRSGSTLLQTLRSAFSGSTLGAQNASEERRRIVPGESYALGFVMGLQESLAADLLNDADGGTPQRCLWWSSTDPSVPNLDFIPPWPGQLNWRPPTVPAMAGDWIVENQTAPYDLQFHEDILREVRIRRLGVVRREVEIDQLDSHLMLVTLKVAALLAILDERLNVDLEDWALAKVILENSSNTRTRVIGTLRKVEAARNRQRVRAEIAQADTRDQEMAAKVRDKITKVLRDRGDVPLRELRQSLSAPQREYFKPELLKLIATGRVLEVGDSEGVRCLLRLAT